MNRSAILLGPTYAVAERIEEIATQQVRFVIEPLGPMRFRLRPVGDRGTFLVGIGAPQTCSCHESHTCTHILYVMMRYFGVPPACDLLWKPSLVDRDIDLLLDGRICRPPPPRKQAVYTTRSGKPKVKRLTIGPDDVCPICYDELAGCDRAKIAWCRLGCGGNFHRKCVRTWIEARRQDGNPPTCPVCREALNVLGIDRPTPPRHSGPRLSDGEIRAIMSRDIGPDDYELLLRLDRPRNQRIRAANRILTPNTRSQPPRPFVAQVVGTPIRIPADAVRMSDARPSMWRPPMGGRRPTDAPGGGLIITSLSIR